jgi:hypothetical protein
MTNTVADAGPRGRLEPTRVTILVLVVVLLGAGAALFGWNITGVVQAPLARAQRRSDRLPRGCIGAGRTADRDDRVRLVFDPALCLLSISTSA